MNFSPRTARNSGRADHSNVVVRHCLDRSVLASTTRCVMANRSLTARIRPLLTYVAGIGAKAQATQAAAQSGQGANRRSLDHAYKDRHRVGDTACYLRLV